MSDKPFNAETQQRRAATLRGSLTGVYRHYKGARYRVLDVVVVEADGELVVIYESLDEGPKQGFRWSRPATEFVGMVGAVKRFTRAP